MKTKTILKQISSWIVALIFLFSAFAPAQAADEQPGPELPIYPGLTWETSPAQEQTIETQDGLVSMVGSTYTAQESLNLDSQDSDELLRYYEQKTLSLAGWQLISALRTEDGNTDTYFHSDGYYLVVFFSACEGNTQLACLSVWQSERTDILPLEESRETDLQAVGTLGKSAPSNGANNINNASVTLSWSAYTGSDLNRYRYCIDTTNNSDCENTGNWTNAWGNKSVTLTNLQGSQTYYWQVQAVLDDNTKVDANSGNWWSFSTIVNTPPAAFGKLLPPNNAVNQSTTPVLTWQASATALSYAYCIDTTNNSICDNTWISTGTNLSATLLSGLAPGTPYYWQVRATNGTGTTAANGSAWHTFTPGNPLPNDFLETATAITVPFSSSINTIPATIDSGTQNSCSPGSGYASVWYKYKPTANGKLYLDTLSSNYDTFIAVWKLASPSNTLVVCNDDQYSTKQSAVNVSVVSGTEYFIQIGHRNANTVPTVTPGGTLNVQVRSYLDVLGNNSFWPYIESLRASGITSGCAETPDQLFCPTTVVTRAQMAVFLLKGMHGAAYTPPAVGASTGFSDVPTNHWAAAWIKQLAAEGITGGCGTGLFCPEGSVTRTHMAIFLLRAKHGSAYAPPAVGASTGFDDVPTTHWAAAWIKQLAAEGITGGCGNNNYCPDSNVNRAQMAVFLVKTFNLP